MYLSLTCIYLIKLRKSNLIYRTSLSLCVCGAFVYACVQVAAMLELPLIAALLLVRGRPFATSLLSVMKLASQTRCLTSDWTQNLDSAFVKPLADRTLQSPLLMHGVSLKCLVISIAMELTAEKGNRRNPAPCTCTCSMVLAIVCSQ